MKRPIVAANWKMNKTLTEARQFTAGLSKKLLNLERTDIILCPPFISLFSMQEILQATPVSLGAQNMHFEKAGAFTGEISAEMLLSVGCEYVILGHSERRHVFNESESFIQKKIRRALEAGLKPIVCVGETLDDREADQTEKVLKRQYKSAFSGVTEAQVRDCIVAYEPVWAIGTGVVATPQQASEAHRFLRQLLAGQYADATAAGMVILYGGSVKPKNARELIESANIDGFLVGGASLVQDQFAAIAETVDEHYQT